MGQSQGQCISPEFAAALFNSIKKRKKETRDVSYHWKYRIDRREVGMEVIRTWKTYSVHSGVSLKNKNSLTDENEAFHIPIMLHTHPNQIPIPVPH